MQSQNNLPRSSRLRVIALKPVTNTLLSLSPSRAFVFPFGT